MIDTREIPVQDEAGNIVGAIHAAPMPSSTEWAARVFGPGSRILGVYLSRELAERRVREAASLPPYVVAGEWEDPEPRHPAMPRRTHPYGPEAWQEVCGDGVARIFPTAGAATLWRSIHERDPGPRAA